MLLKPTPSPASLDVTDCDFTDTIIRSNVAGHLAGEKAFLDLSNLVVGEFSGCNPLNESKGTSLVRILPICDDLEIIKSVIRLVAVDMVNLMAVGYVALKKGVDKAMKVFVELASVANPVKLRVPGLICFQNLASKVFNPAFVRHKIPGPINVLKQFLHDDCLASDHQKYHENGYILKGLRA